MRFVQGLLASLLLGGIPLCAAESTRTVRDCGARGDGQSDDTAAVEKAVAGGGEVRFQPGVYRLTRPVLVKLDQVGPLALVGHGTAQIVMSGSGAAFTFLGTHAGTADPTSVKPGVWQRERTPLIQGLEIVGDHAQACGIEAQGTMQLTIANTVIRKTLHAVHLVGRNRNVILSGCHLYENRGIGVFYDAVNLHQSNITGCHISYNRGGGVVTRGGDVRNIQITGCDIEANMDRDGPPAANVLVDCAGAGAGAAEIEISGCTLQHSPAPGAANIRYFGADAKDRRWGHLTITGNVLSDVEWNVDLQKARDVVITGNTFYLGFGGDLQAVACSNVVVGSNAFDRSPHYNYGRCKEAKGGVVFRDCTDCSLLGLHLNGVERQPAGLVLTNCRRMLVANCTIFDCQSAGVLLEGVSDSRLHGCLIRNDLPDAAGWQALLVRGGKNNRLESP